MLQIEEREDLTPRCPHCDEPVARLQAVAVEARLGKRHAYCCPHCTRILGVSHRKGFWMG